MRESQSEKDGLELMATSDRRILSVGVSTGGHAEISMIESEPNRTIVATTLDEKGAAHMRQILEEKGLQDNIEVRLEDVASVPPADSERGSFDFVYARLVLHYLSRQRLARALNNLYDSLKTGGRLFVVVRSIDCAEATFPDNKYDESTGLTTYKPENSNEWAERFFHTQESITKALSKANFKITTVKQFDELLSPGFNRDSGIWISNNVIEVLAQKD